MSDVGVSGRSDCADVSGGPDAADVDVRSMLCCVSLRWRYNTTKSFRRKIDAGRMWLSTSQSLPVQFALLTPRPYIFFVSASGWNSLVIVGGQYA